LSYWPSLSTWGFAPSPRGSSRGPKSPTPVPRGAPCAPYLPRYLYGGFIYMGLRPKPPLLRLSMRGVPTTPPAVLLHLETIGHFPFVLRRVVVTPLALGAGEDNDVAHSLRPFISVLVGTRSPTRQFR